MLRQGLTPVIIFFIEDYALESRNIDGIIISYKTHCYCVYTGAGRISRLHMQNVLRHRRLDLQWVIDADEKAGLAMKAEFMMGDTPLHTPDRLSQLLEDQR